CRRGLPACGVNQWGRHRAGARVRFRRPAPRAAAADRPDAAADVEGPALLRAEVAAQRRQVRHAIRWLDGGERTVFALWWLELIGELNRTDLAAGLGINVAHAGVRVQRMRERLEAGRRVVAALETMPACAALDQVTARWDGTPGPYWRKRIERHVRTCPVCARAGGDLVPAEPLLAGIALLPVPLTLAGALLAKSLAAGPPAAVAGGATWLARLTQAATVHPVAAAISAGVLAVGIAVPTTWTAAPAEYRAAVGLLPRPGPVPPQPDPASQLPKGKLSLESAAEAGRFVAVAQGRGVLVPVSPASDAAARQRATLEAVTGLGDAACFSLVDADGRYLRHSSFQLRSSPDEGTVLFRRDATFCARAGFRQDSISLESVNFPGFFLRSVDGQLWIDQFDGSDAFRAESSFVVRAPLA
ncbi:AbfB domain-containing protein, partial [Actinoplanes sp. NPDC024001]|uniref:AbfB domain-containing protein n=1 Tax=Actinoplanes sp. NPDC024001 TaxID=3154598 RepID=UPI0033C478E7